MSDTLDDDFARPFMQDSIKLMNEQIDGKRPSGKLERGDAVNLARNIVEMEGYAHALTPIGVRCLAESVLAMDAALRRTDSTSAGKGEETCPACKGTGTVKAMTQQHGPDDYEVDVECPECGGRGA